MFSIFHSLFAQPQNDRGLAFHSHSLCQSRSFNRKKWFEQKFRFIPRNHVARAFASFMIDIVTSSQRHFTDSVIHAAPSLPRRRRSSHEYPPQRAYQTRPRDVGCKLRKLSPVFKLNFNLLFSSSRVASFSATDPIKFWFLINQTIITGLSTLQANALVWLISEVDTRQTTPPLLFTIVF